MSELATISHAADFKKIYTPTRAGRLFETMIDGGSNLALPDLPDQLQTLKASLTAPGRRSYNFTEGKYLYEGQWQTQWDQPTCAPWAIAQSIEAIGLEPDRYYMAHLLSMANIQGGAAIEEARKQAYTNYVNRDFEFQPLNPTITPFSHAKNVETMINAIKQGGAILMVVASREWYKDGQWNRSHAICVPGIEVTPERHVNFQVIDPNVGPAMVSDDYLFKASLAGRSYLFTPRLVSPVQS
jgi:hypothetical protein